MCYFYNYCNKMFCVKGKIYMKKFANKICEHKNLILIITGILMALSFIGMNLTDNLLPQRISIIIRFTIFNI